MVLASCVLPSGIGSIYQGAAAWQLAYITTTPPALHSRQLVILKVRQFLAHLPKNHFYFLLIPEILLQSSWLLSSGTLTPESLDSGFGFKYRGGVLVRFINSSHLYPLRLSGPLWGLHTRGSRGHWSSWEQV